MERLFSVTGKRTVLAAGIALVALLAQRPGQAAGAAQAAQPDTLKFTTNAPVMLGWYVKADKAKDFEDFWSGLKAVMAKSDNADLKAFGETLNKIYRVNLPPFDYQGNQTAIYIFQLDAPSTVISYNPQFLIYTDPNGLRASLENPRMPRTDADPLYDKVRTAVIAINPIWPLIKVG